MLHKVKDVIAMLLANYIGIGKFDGRGQVIWQPSDVESEFYFMHVIR